MKEKKRWQPYVLIIVIFVILIGCVGAFTPRSTCPFALQYNGETYYGGWEIRQGVSIGMEMNGETVKVPWIEAKHLVQVGVVSKEVDITYMPEQDFACNLGVAVGTPVYQMVVRGEYMYVIDYEWKKPDGTLNQMRHFFRERD